MSSNAFIFKTRSGKLSCPYCQGTEKIREIERIKYGEIIRYKCMECGITFRYDRQKMPHPEEQKYDMKARRYANPYKDFTRGIKR